MNDNAHLYHGATLRKMVEEGWFREPLKNQMAEAARKALEESRSPDTQIWRERFKEQEGYDPFAAIFREPEEESE